MSMLAPFELICAASVADVITARRAHPGSRLLAGGTDLIANLRRGIGAPDALIDVTGLPGMLDIEAGTTDVRIGAGVTLSRLTEDPLIRRHLPALADAAATIAAPTHRSSATLGGNLCLDTRCVFYNQSEWWRRSNDFCLKLGGDVCHVATTGQHCHAAYSGDLAPVLLALGAEAEIDGGDGMRRIPLDELFFEDGARHLRLEAEDLLLGVRAPLVPGLTAGYEKVRQRGAIDFPLAGVAVALRRDGGRLADLRVAVTGTNSRPLLVAGVEALIGRPLDAEGLGQISKLVQKHVSPMRTTIAAGNYRRLVASALACRLTRRLFDAQASA